MKKKIQLISCCLILAIFASTAIYIIVMMMSDEKIGGANMNSFCYVNDILPCKYSSLEKAMQAVIEEEFEQVLCTQCHLDKVFYDENSISCAVMH